MPIAIIAASFLIRNTANVTKDFSPRSAILASNLIHRYPFFSSLDNNCFKLLHEYIEFLKFFEKRLELERQSEFIDQYS